MNTLPGNIAAKLANTPLLILPLAGVLIAGIFVQDLLLPLGWVVWLLYLLPLFLTFLFSHRQYLIPLATVCTALIVVGFIHSSPGIPVEAAAFNRSMGVVVLWITTLLLRQHKQAVEAVHLKEHEKQTIFDSVPAMIWYKDKENRILRANKSAAESIGRSVEEVEGRRTEELYLAEAAQYHVDDLEVINTGKPKFGIVEPYQVASGETRWVRTDKIPCRDQSGNIVGVIVCAVDITDCIRAEEELYKAQEELELRVQERTSELRRTIELLKREDAERQRAENAFHTSLLYFQTFMDNSPVVAFMKDEEGRYVYTNRTWQRVFHKTNGEVVGKTDVELWPPETAKQLREHDQAVFAAGHTIELEEVVPTSDGTPHTWVVFKFVLQGPSERRLLGGVALDITERKQAEEALRRSEEQLRLVLEERERLSQDLHDNIIQRIYAIGLGLEECQHLMTEDSTVAVKKLRHALAQLNVVIRDVRNYIVMKEPDRISAVPLRTELTRLARAINESHSLRFRINLDPLAASQLTPEEAKHVLSIAHEAMSNGLRHSGARTGVVSLQMEQEAVRLIVEDSGVGFDAQTLKVRGQGLRNIAARAQKLGAHLQVMSERGRGTRILVDIPKEQVHVPAGD